MTEDLKKKRDAIISKVRALLSKTTENGCTEQEAMAAAALAGKLMAEHDLAHVDLESEVRGERYGARRKVFGTAAKSHEVTFLAKWVADYFDCKIFREGGNVLVLFGSDTDTDLAIVFLSMLQMAMDGEWQRYLNGPQRDRRVNGRTLRTSFMSGMIIRLRERLEAMKHERNAPATGRALVVVKGQIVTEKYANYMRQNGFKLGRDSGRGKRIGDRAASEAGKAAANRIDLGGGKVGGNSSTRIGGR